MLVVETLKRPSALGYGPAWCSFSIADHLLLAESAPAHVPLLSGLTLTLKRGQSRGQITDDGVGEIELRVPRTRRFSALGVVRAYAQRTSHIDQMILACFVLGLSTRKVAVALQPVLGRRLGPGTVSQVGQVAKMLDKAVCAFHRRPLNDHYPVLMLDGVVLARKTGLGALRRPVLVEPKAFGGHVPG